MFVKNIIFKIDFMSRILLITPPLTQLNTPYPAICQLHGFLKQKGIDSAQADLSIELIDELFTARHLKNIFEICESKKTAKRFRIMISQADFYIRTIEPVMRFMSGRDDSLDMRFSTREFWPASKRIPEDEDLEWGFGAIGNHDRAIHLCTLFLKDISELIQENIDPNFELIRYAESLCLRLPEFGILERELKRELSYTDEVLLQILEKKIDLLQPEFVGFSIPFPGNLYGALRCAQWLKQHHPHIKIILGGGYVNTELRQMTDTGIFAYTDYITFDDGELPLLRILNGGELVRTMYLNTNNELEYINADSPANIPFAELPAPDYEGLTENHYINMIELTNPMHALWSNGRWNKMTLAHGCYWGKCAFCDGTLDYIGRFERTGVEAIVDKMETVMQQTGISGFHFVDEAAPPAILKKLAEEIIRRKLIVSYWTNIRFEKSFTPELCYLLAQSGCIAVSGGLEVASPRILRLINKGVTIESASESMKNLAEAGIMTHAYLMYGFPTETAKETIESLEVVRDLFSKGWIQSAFWHRYAMTIHSPSGKNPESVGARSLQKAYNPFANNEIPFATDHEIDLDYYGKGLSLATYNFMNGAGFDINVNKWFG